MSPAQISLVIGLLGLVVGVARLHPKDAFLNLSAWVELVRHKRADKLIVLVSLIITAIGGAILYLEAPMSAPPLAPAIPLADQPVHGQLKPANDPTPPNGCGPQPPDVFKVLIGDNAIGMSGYGKFTALQIGSCEAVSMERTPDGVYLNAQLVDTDENKVVQILRNKIDALNGGNLHCSTIQ
jgi:hypothetical protein